MCQSDPLPRPVLGYSTSHGTVNSRLCRENQWIIPRRKTTISFLKHVLHSVLVFSWLPLEQNNYLSAFFLTLADLRKFSKNDFRKFEISPSSDTLFERFVAQKTGDRIPRLPSKSQRKRIRNKKVRLIFQVKFIFRSHGTIVYSAKMAKLLLSGHEKPLVCWWSN